jgi:hypothetical protein
MGGKPKEAQQTPPLNAKSQDEEKFIKYVNRPHDHQSAIYATFVCTWD